MKTNVETTKKAAATMGGVLLTLAGVAIVVVSVLVVGLFALMVSAFPNPAERDRLYRAERAKQISQAIQLGEDLVARFEQTPAQLQGGELQLVDQQWAVYSTTLQFPIEHSGIPQMDLPKTYSFTLKLHAGSIPISSQSGYVYRPSGMRTTNWTGSIETFVSDGGRTRTHSDRFYSYPSLDRDSGFLAWPVRFAVPAASVTALTGVSLHLDAHDERYTLSGAVPAPRLSVITTSIDAPDVWPPVWFADASASAQSQRPSFWATDDLFYREISDVRSGYIGRIGFAPEQAGLTTLVMTVTDPLIDLNVVNDGSVLAEIDAQLVTNDAFGTWRTPYFSTIADPRALRYGVTLRQDAPAGSKQFNEWSSTDGRASATRKTLADLGPGYENRVLELRIPVDARYAHAVTAVRFRVRHNARGGTTSLHYETVFENLPGNKLVSEMRAGHRPQWSVRGNAGAKGLSDDVSLAEVDGMRHLTTTFQLTGLDPSASDIQIRVRLLSQWRSSAQRDPAAPAEIDYVALGTLRAGRLTGSARAVLFEDVDLEKQRVLAEIPFDLPAVIASDGSVTVSLKLPVRSVDLPYLAVAMLRVGDPRMPLPGHISALVKVSDQVKDAQAWLYRQTHATFVDATARPLDDALGKRYPDYRELRLAFRLPLPKELATPVSITLRPLPLQLLDAGDTGQFPSKPPEISRRYVITGTMQAAQLDLHMLSEVRTDVDAPYSTTIKVRQRLTYDVYSDGNAHVLCVFVIHKDDIENATRLQIDVADASGVIVQHWMLEYRPPQVVSAAVESR
jgi:hypothetical protein